MGGYRGVVAPFINSLRFAEVLESTDSVVSGSVALQFCHYKDCWEPDSLDVYTPRSHAGAVILYMVEEEGYSIFSVVCLKDQDPAHGVPGAIPVPTMQAHHGSPSDQLSDDDDNANDNSSLELKDETKEDWFYRCAGVRTVSYLSHGHSHVKIHCSALDSDLLPISHSWATGLMNALTGTTFVCGYLMSTFGRRFYVTPFAMQGAVLLPVLNFSSNCGKFKYSCRNYELYDSRYDLPFGLERTLMDPCVPQSFLNPDTFRVEFGYQRGRHVRTQIEALPWYCVVWWLGGRTGHKDYRAVTYTVDTQSGHVDDHGPQEVY